MFSGNVGRLTAFMIYLGTLLISILSFFTTFKGLCIILTWELALLGSLGLQTAMLGIAWNLIKIRENRGSYVLAFLIAAVFSIFFSYANFDINLKENTRPHEVRNLYYETAKPVLSEYSARAKKTVLAARYQVDRINSLLEMEEERGWATIVDEGSQDRFIQSIIDGARFTVESWKKSTGSDYRQGKGQGIILNYLESQKKQVDKNLAKLLSYTDHVDSLALKLTAEVPVSDQYNIVNKAYINFPIGVVSLIAFEEDIVSLSQPPPVVDFTEKPASSQQALMLVINDLLNIDNLTLLSLLLAIAIDFIVILVAFAGSHIMEKSDFFLEKIEDNTHKRLKDVKLDDIEKFDNILDNNLRIYKRAAQYEKDINRISEEHRNIKSKLHPETGNDYHLDNYNNQGRRTLIIKHKSRLRKWLSHSKLLKSDR